MYINFTRTNKVGKYTREGITRTDIQIGKRCKYDKKKHESTNSTPLTTSLSHSTFRKIYSTLRYKKHPD